jgi:hypothetical protein
MSMLPWWPPDSVRRLTPVPGSRSVTSPPVSSASSSRLSTRSTESRVMSPTSCTTSAPPHSSLSVSMSGSGAYQHSGPRIRRPRPGLDLVLSLAGLGLAHATPSTITSSPTRLVADGQRGPLLDSRHPHS